MSHPEGTEGRELGPSEGMECLLCRALPTSVQLDDGSWAVSCQTPDCQSPVFTAGKEATAILRWNSSIAQISMERAQPHA